MKRLSLIFIIAIITLSVSAQDTLKTKSHLNEFGIDATGFLKDYLNIGNSQQFPTTYTPTYYLTYRRHFSGGNLRVAIGGDFTYEQVPDNFSGNMNLNYDHAYSLNASIGWESYNNLSKKWQVYYGADIRTGLSDSHTDATNDFGPNFEEGEISQIQALVFAPFLGIRFKLTKRLSILTEASYAINWVKNSTTNFPVLLPGGSGPLPATTNQSYAQVYSSFSQPLSVFIDFTI